MASGVGLECDCCVLQCNHLLPQCFCAALLFLRLLVIPAILSLLSLSLLPLTSSPSPSPSLLPTGSTSTSTSTLLLIHVSTTSFTSSHQHPLPPAPRLSTRPFRTSSTRRISRRSVRATTRPYSRNTVHLPHLTTTTHSLTVDIVASHGRCGSRASTSRDMRCKSIRRRTAADSHHRLLQRQEQYTSIKVTSPSRVDHL